MKPINVTALRRMAAFESAGFVAGIVGIAMGSPALMLLSAGVLASYFAQRETEAAFFDFHAPGTLLLIVVAMCIGWPWWHGVCLALVLFAALDMPLNIAIFVVPAKEVAQRLGS